MQYPLSATLLLSLAMGLVPLGCSPVAVKADIQERCASGHYLVSGNTIEFSFLDLLLSLQFCFQAESSLLCIHTVQSVCTHTYTHIHVYIVFFNFYKIFH